MDLEIAQRLKVKQGEFLQQCVEKYCVVKQSYQIGLTPMGDHGS